MTKPCAAAPAAMIPYTHSIFEKINKNEFPAPFGDYDIAGILGHGGFGITMTAYPRSERDVRDKHWSVIKIPQHTHSTVNEIAINEYLSLQENVSPHILVAKQIIDDVCIVSDYRGRTLLDQYFKEGSPPISEDDLRRINQQGLQAIAWLSLHKLVHKDIKPGNILYENKHLTLIDMGLATFVGMPASQSCGTMPWRSRDSYLDPKGMDSTSDAYSFCLVTANIRMQAIKQRILTPPDLKDTQEGKVLDLYYQIDQTGDPTLEEAEIASKQKVNYVIVKDGKICVMRPMWVRPLAPWKERYRVAAHVCQVPQQAQDEWIRFYDTVFKTKAQRSKLGDIINAAPPLHSAKRKALADISNQVAHPKRQAAHSPSPQSSDQENVSAPANNLSSTDVD